MKLRRRDRVILKVLWKRPHASIRELMAVCDIPSTYSVNYRLKQLNHLGYIKPKARRSGRTTRLTPAGLLAAQGYKVIWWETGVRRHVG